MGSSLDNNLELMAKCFCFYFNFNFYIRREYVGGVRQRVR